MSRARPLPAKNVEFAELTSLAEVEPLESEWRDLCGRVSATPFQLPDWLIPWYRWFDDAVPAFCTIRIDGVLEGVVPLARIDRDGAAVTLLGGSGNSDHLDAVVSASARELLPDLFDSLASDHPLLELQELSDDSALLEMDATPCFESEVEQQSVCPRLDLSNCDAIEDLVSAHFAKRLRYLRQRVERIGTVEFAGASGAAAASLFRLHDSRWSARGETGVLVGERLRSFHEEVIERMSVSRMLRFYEMKIDGRSAAAFYGFACGGSTSYYLGGFDPQFADLSPGLLVVAHAISEAIAEGQEVFDFLRGSENYKYRWGAVDRVNFKRTLRRRADETAHATTIQM